MLSNIGVYGVILWLFISAFIFPIVTWPVVDLIKKIWPKAPTSVHLIISFIVSALIAALFLMSEPHGGDGISIYDKYGWL